MKPGLLAESQVRTMDTAATVLWLLAVDQPADWVGQPVVECAQRSFQVTDGDDDVERKAVLAPTGVDADATGEAEVEFSKDAPANQEVEFTVRNVSAGAVLTFVIDGTDVATTTADRRGRAEVELDVRMPGTTAAR